MGGSHEHHHSRERDERFVAAALALIVVFMVGEVVAGLLAGSLALLADAGHMLSDAGALGLSIWALRLARRPARGAMTFGLKRAEILSALANATTLLVVAAAVAVEAVLRLVAPGPVDGVAVVAVAGAGLVVNLAATVLLGRADRSSLNLSGALAHLVTDVWAFAATLAAGVVIVVAGWRRADAVASLVTVTLMVRAGWSLGRAAGRILLEGAPDGVDLDELRRHLLEVPHVTAVHDLHAWVVTSDMPAVSAHVVVNDDCFASGLAPQLLDQLQECLAGHFDVTHSTFQLEPAGHADHEADHDHA
ncbi:MAG TPA: cation diffusion facilitator family transporter [Acidimicrobiales bacterium]|nr:cation diffusion facilitator family transporter [Acidimicrobiales bacterium]